MLKKTHAVLPVPRVSGMDENNTINKATLTEPVVVKVPHYDLPSSGDEVVVHFGSHTQSHFVTDANLSHVIMVQFAPETLDAGIWSVSYTVTDVSGNDSTSLALSVTITDGEDLMAPSVAGTVSGELDLTAVTGGNITVNIPADNGNLQPGDDVMVYISEAGTSHHMEHIVVQDINPHHVSFRAGDFAAGKHEVWYTRERNGVTETAAKLGLVFVNGVKPQPPVSCLPAPVLPQSVDGNINLSGLTEDVVVEILPYEGMVKGDVIQAYIGTLRVTPHVIVEDSLKLHIQTVNPLQITSGQQSVYYTVTRADGNLFGTSGTVLITFNYALHLKVPEITGEKNGVLNLHDVHGEFVEMIVPSWEGIARGDVIRGFVGNTEAVPHIIVQDALSVHTLKFDKSALKMGACEAYYTVKTVSGQAGKSPYVALNIINISVPEVPDNLPAPYLDGHVESYDLNKAPGGYVPINIDEETWWRYSGAFIFKLEIISKGTTLQLPIKDTIALISASLINKGLSIVHYILTDAMGKKISKSNSVIINFTRTEVTTPDYIKTLKKINEGAPFSLKQFNGGWLSHRGSNGQFAQNDCLVISNGGLHHRKLKIIRSGDCFTLYPEGLTCVGKMGGDYQQYSIDFVMYPGTLNASYTFELEYSGENNLFYLKSNMGYAGPALNGLYCNYSKNKTIKFEVHFL